MDFNRFFQNMYQSEISGKDVCEREENAFKKILQEEYNQLMQLVNDAEEKGTTVQLYQKCNPRDFGHLFPEE
ncbi:MAG: hypothetical protein D8M57_10095 [Candidatus Scalindua sp. AMX11]|nr:MAG: hypothetical protein DWQ00_08845 [Candidatus Scalindua sp.]NOG84843.1 hypothetical protein [Planctomycetota bacterium]RZV84913.1 MAG: hypothetical protein EX341_07855 [Candidatus Scalindua sp. SCAELEC01]TDE65096.1 MAG: hypothetical protein D8M57_10095 [Candidatus Scalindua sp. AMX11]GJQ59488.1 MAG: hypothetical protein SCALA701_22890 [Candidatus Scalindua sp.]